MTKTIKFITKIFWKTIKRFFLDNYTYRASALAFTSLLALVPLLSIIFFLVTRLPNFTQFITTAENHIFNNFLPNSGDKIQFYLQSFVEKANKLPMIGMLFLLFTAAMLITTITNTFNDIWHAEKRKRKFYEWVRYWITLLLFPFFIGLSISASSYLFSLSWFTHAAAYFGFEIYLLKILLFLINMLIFSTLYIILPRCHVRWREGFLGGFTAAILFEIAKKGFSFYLIHFPSYELIYGVLATLPIFLLWIYIAWVIVLFGALLTQMHHEVAIQFKHPIHRT